jgi:uncharacterized iron-regulated membrane protein
MIHVVFNLLTYLFFHPTFLTSSHLWYESFKNCITNFFFLQKLSPEELADMPTYNLSKAMHNVWLDKSSKMGTCLYVGTLDDYI